MHIDEAGAPPGNGPAIARIWRGATREEDGRAYRDSLREDVREIRSAEGNVGAFVLERTDTGRAEFTFISLWESMDAVRGFAGADPERAVYFRDDERMLLELTPYVEHYEIVAADVDPR
jgi:heme-degrading monooxygenase HmoA